jgi:BirA family biotin operon repressor/biotin-[acetyl-CoA-carboxylase] ligase
VERSSGVTVRLKWPNDLIAGERKLGGILAEVAGDAVVIGLGVNVRQSEFPEEIEATATSLLREGSRPLGRAALLGAVLNAFEPFASDPRSALSAYRERCDTLGREIRVERPAPAGPLNGRAAAVDDSGALVVETHDGEVVVNAGDVIHVR